ncbi:metallophosphoesterase [Panacibacter ginsenosidivorans]|uniref:Metallophosphoesterase n=1 Tax=Panacibacter ginsenosidivorans TaxID=1813871 RepID=A0A5B8VGT5_9BACT|nr:metallophosphoesterase [Panacibacter ginsenosidivorans]
MRRSLKFLLTKPVLFIVNRFSSAPKRENVFASLTKLYNESLDQPDKKSGSMFSFDPREQSIIIFSDHHKGARDGSDDFRFAEKNYLAALDYYNEQNFFYVNLGDGEELWENTIFSVLKHNKEVFAKEKLFADRDAYCKIIGNHDLFWKNDPFTAQLYIKKMYGRELKMFEGIVLRVQLPTKYVDVFCTHGHQGDVQSDGNAFSKWFVSYIWGPLQSFLEININSTSANDNLKSLHNKMMYDWVYEKPYCILITGHTHQPVFKSLTHLERLYLALEDAKEKNDAAAIDKIEAEIPRRRREYDFVNNSFRNMNPSYFNSGCCCFDDGTITGIELDKGFIRLIKWSYKDGVPERIVAEETSLYELLPFMA